MRWYVIDELETEAAERLTARLREMELEGSIDGLYWLPLPAALLSAVQREHDQSCGPHVMALEVEEHSLRLELLVRARSRLRCDCVHYASPALVTHMIEYLEQLLTDLSITS
ncbi:MAG: hypothetical protein IJD16_01055 [Desulfovibrio sp.]|nr:hypothetical protein [Desulfovibrio sp.]